MSAAHALTPLAAALALTFLSSGAMGQVAAPQSPAQADAAKAEADKKKKVDAKLEAVVVTSSKRNELAHRLPYNVTAIGEQALRDENITDLKKLIQASPSIEAPPNSARCNAASPATGSASPAPA
jgi:outer membrane receptor protein involved in Fe transport